MENNTTLIYYLERIKAFKNQRICWMKSSFVVAALVALTVTGWNWIVSQHLVWAFATCSLVVSATWWYWTMSMVKDLIELKQDEAVILSDLISDIKEMKEKVRQLD